MAQSTVVYGWCSTVDKWRDGRIAPDSAGDRTVPSQDYRHVRRSKIDIGAKRACLPGRERGAGSLSIEHGADVKHDGDARAGRRTGHGAFGSARI